jgi:hypothetical protein
MNSTSSLAFLSNSSTINIESWYIPVDILNIICLTLIIILSLLFLLIIVIDKTCHTLSMLFVGNSCVAAVIHVSNMCWMGIFRLQNDLQAKQYQDRLCVFRGYLIFAFCAIVICSFLLQALYRYIIVFYPTRVNWLSVRIQLLLIVLTWIYGLVFPVTFMFTGDIIYNADNAVCDIPLRLSFALIFLALCVYCVPLSLVMFIYLKLILYVKKMNKRVTPANVLFRVQCELKMIRRIVIMVTVLVPICIPYAIFFILSFFISLPVYYFRILSTFAVVSLLYTMLIVFKFTDPLKLSVMKKLNIRSKVIVQVVRINNI